MDLKEIKKIYFIGIKGVAMSGLAVICHQRGMEVCGSDVPEKFITDAILEEKGIMVFNDFSPQNLDYQPDLVVIGTSWGEENVEVAEVEKRGIPHITDSELRGLLSKEKRTIAVTGVHGKTTTTALVSFLFRGAGLEPSFLVGTGMVPDLGANAGWFPGKHFIVEGDEYTKSKTDKTPKFLDLHPAISIITSLEWEHVDVFRDLEIMETYFAQLADKTSDLLVVCSDWPSIKKIITGHKDKTVMYGLQIGNDYQAYNIRPEFSQTVFAVRHGKEELGDFSLKLFGEHNVLNALSAIIVGLHEGIKLAEIKKILPNFSGAQRRFEVWEKGGIIFIDDYAHHPTAIKTTLKAIRTRYPDKTIYCVFQPHTVSRTKALLDDFVRSFSDVDHIIFTDIFASAREGTSDFTSKDLAKKAEKHHPKVIYSGNLDNTAKELKKLVKPGDVLVTMGAGDVYKIIDYVTDIKK